VGRALKPELDRGGLFLWACATRIPTFVLGGPDLQQAPSYEFRRLRTGPNEPIQNVNVIAASLKHETTERFSRCEVHFRNGGASQSREAAFGIFVDDEMTALGFNRPLIIEDKKCKSLNQATFLARRKIAAANRKGWQYTVTIAGHTTLGIGNDQMVVPVPDTIATVRDDEYGIDADLWVESVHHEANPQATTTIKMMRVQDCAFGEPDGVDVGTSTKAVGGPDVRIGVTTPGDAAFKQFKKGLS
jgi:prophage tail gpP-like protein